MLHCAKMRGSGHRGNFVPAGALTTKLTTGRCDVTVSWACRYFASLRSSLYD
jgi:hypothetical protein